MKTTALPVLACLALLSISCGKKAAGSAGSSAPDGGVILAEKGYLPPAGTAATKTVSMVMKDAEMTVKAGDQELVGSASQSTKSTESMEFIKSHKARRLLTSKRTDGEMTMNGQVQATPNKADPLENVAVILERGSAGWTAVLESGEKPEAAQQQELDKLVKGLNRDGDFSMYGGGPRKPGDKWDVDPAQLVSFGGAEDLTGTYTVEFVEKKTHEGMDCAVLKAVFDLKGKTEAEGDQKPMDLHFKGESVAYRSIADQFDLQTEITGTMIMEGSPAPNVRMKLEGPMTGSDTSTLKRP